MKSLHFLTTTLFLSFTLAFPLSLAVHIPDASAQRAERQLRTRGDRARSPRQAPSRLKTRRQAPDRAPSRHSNPKVQKIRPQERQRTRPTPERAPDNRTRFNRSPERRHTSPTPSRIITPEPQKHHKTDRSERNNRPHRERNFRPEHRRPDYKRPEHRRPEHRRPDYSRPSYRPQPRRIHRPPRARHYDFGHHNRPRHHRPRTFIRYYPPAFGFFYGYYPRHRTVYHYNHVYHTPPQQVIILERDSQQTLPTLDCPPQSRPRQTELEQWCETPRGTRHGPFIRWHENGHIAAEGNYENGQPDGVWTEWHDNGQVMSEGAYEDGARTGTWVYWDQDGEEISITRYE